MIEIFAFEVVQLREFSDHNRISCRLRLCLRAEQRVHRLVKDRVEFVLAEISQRAVVVKKFLDEALLRALHSEHGPIGTENYLVIYPSIEQWVERLYRTHFESADVEVNVRSESTKHDALFDVGDAAVREYEVNLRKIQRSLIDKNRLGCLESQRW